MTHIPEVQIHNILGLRAKAKRHGITSWLELMFHDNESDAEITAFMPYETALEYANAINACNDRESLDREAAELDERDESHRYAD